MTILQSVVETLTQLHLRREEGFAQGTPVVIVRRSEDRLIKGKITWRVAVMKKKTRPLRLLWWREIRKMFVPTMNVSIDGIVQEVLIDSGSVSNLMRDDFQKDDFQKLICGC